MEVGLARNQVDGGFEVGEDEIFVRGVDLGEGGEQLAKIDFGAADAAGDQIQRVDADARHSTPDLLQLHQAGLRVGIVGIQRQSAAEFAHRGGGVALKGKNLTAIGVDGIEIRVDFFRFVQFVESVVHVLKIGVHHGNLRVDVGGVFELPGLLHFRQRFLPTAGAAEGEAPIDQESFVDGCEARCDFIRLHGGGATAGAKLGVRELKAGAVLVGGLGDAVLPEGERALPDVAALVGEGATKQKRGGAGPHEVRERQAAQEFDSDEREADEGKIQAVFGEDILDGDDGRRRRKKQQEYEDAVGG